MGARTSGWVALLTVGSAIATSAVMVAQTGTFDRNTILIDPAHGGADAGGHIESRFGDQIQEKDVTLALAAKLRPLLAAKGFNIAVTRTGDTDAGGPDQRAELANRSHAVACIILHASASSTGVVLGTSALGTALTHSIRGGDGRPAEGGPGSVPWGRAQAPYLVQSDRLANQLGTALNRANVAATITRVVMRPIDNLTCPVVSIELGVLAESGMNSLQASDDAYQQHVAESLADALTLWRNLAQPPEPFEAQPRAGR